jgi:hypothetical protein
MTSLALPPIVSLVQLELTQAHHTLTIASSATVSVLRVVIAQLGVSSRYLALLESILKLSGRLQRNVTGFAVQGIFAWRGVQRPISSYVATHPTYALKDHIGATKYTMAFIQVQNL